MTLNFSPEPVAVHPPPSPRPPVAPRAAVIRPDLRLLLVAVAVWRRELVLFLRAPARIVALLAGPLLFLFVFGWGLSPVVSVPGAGRADYQLFLLPGVMVMAMLFVGVHNAVGIVQDRETGFLREMLVAPVPIWTILLGKALGSATVAFFQGVVVLAIGVTVGLRPTAATVVATLAITGLVGLLFAGFGICIACRMKSMAGFQAVMTLMINPLFFCSGALFPPNSPGGLLGLAIHLDPVSYTVDVLRRVLAPAGSFGGGMRLGTSAIPLPVELAAIVALTLAALALASLMFRRSP